MSENKTSLVIDLDQDYRIKFEELKDFTASFFNEIYHKAAESTNRIIEQNEKQDNQLQKSDFYRGSAYNNVIAFVGDRGTGKSSAMTSFCNALLSSNQKNTELEFDFFKNYSEIKNTNFVSVQTIDPSLFHDKDNLFEIIIAQLFAKFQKKLKDDPTDVGYEKKGELLGQFQKVYANIRTVNRQDQHYGEEAIDALSNLAFGSNLSDSFKTLVEKYITFFSGSKEGRLIIAIDDFDLNVKGAYQMLEDVRKYLITNNIILFIACKIDQLLNALEEEIRSGFKEIVKAKDAFINESPITTAENYLEKLIPADRRLYLPELQVFSKSRDNAIHIIHKTKEETLENESIEDVVLREIYKNTGLFIAKPSYDLHTIVPLKFRSLTNLMTMYRNMDESPASLSRLQRQLLDNDVFKLREFDGYNRVGGDIRNHNFNFFAQFGSFIPLNLNQRIIQFLEENSFFPMREGVSQVPMHAIQLVNRRNKPLNISIGDLIWMMNTVQFGLNGHDEYEKKFLSGLKIIYNLYLLNTLISKKDGRQLMGGSILCVDRGNYLPDKRDIFEFDYGSVREKFLAKEITEEEFLWIHCFIIYLGDRKNNFRTDSEIYYQMTENATVGKYSNATFSFLDFITNSIYIENIIDRVVGLTEEKIRETELYKAIISWRNENNQLVKLFHNIEFLALFISKVSTHCYNFRQGLPTNYSGKMKIYLVNQTEKAIQEIIKEYKYSYLGLTKTALTEHPLIKYWQLDNNERINNLLDSIKPSDNNEEMSINDNSVSKEVDAYLKNKINDKAKAYLNWVNKQFRIGRLDERITGIKKASTNRVNWFKELDKYHQDRLQRLRWLMNDDIEKGLNLTKEYLENIINNG